MDELPDRAQFPESQENSDLLDDSTATQKKPTA
jgi:hypothetical protein